MADCPNTFLIPTQTRESQAVFQSLAARARSWLSDWVKARIDESPSWLVSFVLHLGILVLLFLCPIVLSGDYHAESTAGLLTRLELGDGMGFLDHAVSVEGRGMLEGGEALHDGRGEPEGSKVLAGDSRDDVNAFNSQAAGADGTADAAHAMRSEVPHLKADGPTPAPVVEVDREPEATTASPSAANGRGKAARTTQRKANNGKEVPINVAGMLDGREPGARAKLAKSGGATKESERAVDLGLDWLVRHQQDDGSWSFQHGPDDPGTEVCPTGATGLALLAFLGAGHTHKKGLYRSQVNLGLKYLVDNMQETHLGGYMGGRGHATMYVQGICGIALCEACSMTKDPLLRRPAQLTIDFIVKVQDPEGGGWRYQIPQPGDTSVLGWQLMALQSARIAELNVPPQVITKAARFLKSVESEGGAAFGYTSPNGSRPSTTAVGLLCRMYLGRGQEHKGMIRGMHRLSKWGPDASEMYYSYYATQAMHHWGEDLWEKWNAVMREQLVARQEQQGDAAGSWMTDRSLSSHSGGRLYTTCLSIMTLEVYYRHLPIYRRPSAAETVPTSEAEAAGEVSAAEQPRLPAEKRE